MRNDRDPFWFKTRLKSATPEKVQPLKVFMVTAMVLHQKTIKYLIG